MDCQSCIICRSLISKEERSEVNKLEAVFLLQIVFEIPEGSYLVENLNDELFNVINICKQCCQTVKQCKEVYGEIGQVVKRFLELKNKILGDTSNSSSSTTEDKANRWTDQFRTFVKHHEFDKSTFPFVVEDLEELIKGTAIKMKVEPEDNPSDDPLEGTSTSTVKITNLMKRKIPSEKYQDELEIDASEVESDESDFEFRPTPFNKEGWTRQTKKGDKDSSDEGDDDNSSNDESGRPKRYKGNPFKKSQAKYGLKKDPKTLRYTCVEPGCDKSSVSCAYIRKHYETVHLKIRKRKIFNCGWPGCGKTSVCKTYITKHYEAEHAKKNKGNSKTISISRGKGRYQQNK